MHAHIHAITIAKIRLAFGKESKSANVDLFLINFDYVQYAVNSDSHIPYSYYPGAEEQLPFCNICNTFPRLEQVRRKKEMTIGKESKSAL